MGLKSDRWIKFKARHEGMIEPFYDSLIRKSENGEKVISYGLSSYGYDIRIAPEFKIFTNVNSAIVDPKNFDESTFVAINADACIIPPNSFILGYSAEKIKTPDDTLILCIGKSSYARCFDGATKVALANGTSLSLEEMSKKPKEPYFGYGVLADGTIIITELLEPRFVGKDSLLEVELDTGGIVKCTPDHEWMLRDGTYLEASQLKAGTSIMPLYRYVSRGYEAVMQQNGKQWSSTHRLADEWNLLNEIYLEEEDTHRHHIDENKRNNYPSNIIRMNSTEHLKYHNYFRDLDPELHSSRIKEAFEKLKQDPEWVARFSEAQSIRIKNWFAKPGVKEAHGQAMKSAWTDTRRAEASQRQRQLMQETLQEHSQKMKDAWEDDVDRKKRQAEFARQINIRDEITEEKIISALKEAGTIRGAAQLLNCDRSVFRRFPELNLESHLDRKKITEEDAMDALKEAGTIRGAARLLNCSRSVFRKFPKIFKDAAIPPKNHKIKAIRECAGLHDVFCVTSAATGNFALETGVFVKNCGLIVNVTPMEPGWEGHITLEISNTTPLPAKIYANEGIAQLLFFEGDDPCEVTYRDRKGKYQNQPPEVVLPRL